MSAPALIVCGSLTIDNVVTAEETRLPRAPAGNVVYAALGAALWGLDVGLVSRAGADFPGDFLQALADRGLDLGGIARLDRPHGMNVAFAYAADGSRVRAFPAALMARIPPGERARFTDYTTHGPAHRYATWLDFAPDASDLPSGWSPRGAHLAAMPVQRQLSLATSLRRAASDAHVQLDSPWYDEREPERDFRTELARALDLMLPSEADLLTWRPGLDPLEAAADLARGTRRPILVKRGSAGCLLFDADGGQALAVPAFPIPVLDPTGAGDAFCGGVLAGIALHGDLRQALACGTASASFAIAGRGLQGLLAATRDEAESRAAWVAEHSVTLHPTEARA